MKNDKEEPSSSAEQVRTFSSTKSVFGNDLFLISGCKFDLKDFFTLLRV